MKISIKFILLVAALLLSVCIKAQTYPSTDSEGNKVYYKIMSAKYGFEKKCLEDNTPNTSTSDYKFLVNEAETGNQYQEWEIIADASNNKYYLRNRRSRRYINTKGYWTDNFLSVESAISKQTTKPYEFIPLEKDQIALKYNDGKNTLYLGAVDPLKEMPVFNEYFIENSNWAWYITDDKGTPVSIEDIKMSSDKNISVIDGKIIVKGNDNYKIYDTEGRLLPHESTLLPGIYLVKTEEDSYKIAVR